MTWAGTGMQAHFQLKSCTCVAKSMPAQIQCFACSRSFSAAALTAHDTEVLQRMKFILTAGLWRACLSQEVATLH